MLHGEIVGGILEDGPLDAESIRHVKDLCRVEDSCAASYLGIAGGSAALAAAFYEAANHEIALHFGKLGVKAPEPLDFDKEAMQFALLLYSSRHQKCIPNGHNSCQLCEYSSANNACAQSRD